MCMLETADIWINTSSTYHPFPTNTYSSVLHLNFKEIGELCVGWITVMLCSYPLPSRGLWPFFLCVSSDKLGENDLQSRHQSVFQAGFALGRSPIRFMRLCTLWIIGGVPPTRVCKRLFEPLAISPEVDIIVYCTTVGLFWCCVLDLLDLKFSTVVHCVHKSLFISGTKYIFVFFRPRWQEHLPSRGKANHR